METIAQDQAWYECLAGTLLPLLVYTQISMSYITLMGDRPTLWGADLIWSKLMLPKHRVLVLLAVHGNYSPEKGC